MAEVAEMDHDRMDIDTLGDTAPAYEVEGGGQSSDQTIASIDGRPHPRTVIMEDPPDVYDDDAGEEDEDDVMGNVSDADSDEMELRANTARFDAMQEAFVAQQRAVGQPEHPSSTASSAAAPAVASYEPDPIRAAVPSAAVIPASTTSTPSKTTKSGGMTKPPPRKRGPRKAVKPTPDIQFRLSLARRAFEDSNFEGTIQMLSEIIRINSETYQAWTLLSTVHEELGDREKATMCLMTAAHLVPKNVSAWISAAQYALHGVEDMEDDSPERATALDRAITCYSQALVADKRNIEARTGKADVLMMQGHSALALAQYNRALEFRPLNIRTVRNMADVALDAKDPRKTAEGARRAYRRVIDHLQATGTFETEEGMFEWSDLRIYLEFLSILELWGQAARELKEISRWLLGRKEEAVIWDQFPDDDDDREWDLNDDRRILVPEFEPAMFPLDSYGAGLPLDLRAKLFVYRRKLGMNDEADMHLTLLDPNREEAVDDFMDFPDCLKDIGNALLDGDSPEKVMAYFNLYRKIMDITGDVIIDADYLVSQGRCHLALGDKVAAEECFIAAIEADEDHIEARVQLANMYEGEQEQEGREEAFLLVSQALNLEMRRGEDGGIKIRKPRKPRGPYGPRKPKEGQEKRERQPRQPGEKKRSAYIPRRLINAEKRRQQDLKMAEIASKNYATLVELKEKVVAGAEDEETRAEWEQTQAEWMRAARELVDDFRSYKDFYPWEKYIKYLGYGGNVQGQASLPSRNLKLAAMAERLQQNLAPATAEGQEGAAAIAARTPAIPQEHRGIPFDKWLDIFLDYAFCLVRSGNHKEAYVVCHAARDSTIWTSTETTYLIHLAWASCAVYAADEETCVAIARYFMRDYMPGTDSYRMFSAMCRVCQTPVSWYTSGPAQKFILRQIKIMDNIMMKKMRAVDSGSAVGDISGNPFDEPDDDDDDGDGNSEGGGDDTKEQEKDLKKLVRIQKQYENAMAASQANPEKYDDGIALDVCLLTIYGHILFSTTSYVYALNYLARSASIDPHNCLINMSIGLAYLHYALKRQATQRQYLLTQAFAFLFRYYEDRLAPRRVTFSKRVVDQETGEEETVRIEKEIKPNKAERQEAHFNIGRAYSLIGLGNLSNDYYLKVLQEKDDDPDDEEEEEEDVAEVKRGGGMGNEELTIEAAYNIRTMCFLLGDIEGARVVAERWMVL